MQQRKLAEAQELQRQADKLLAKRSLFRATPDFLSAAPLLERAGEAFRAAGDLEAAKRALSQAAGAQQKNQSSFRAAQAFEGVARVASQQLKLENGSSARLNEVIRAYEAASGQYGDMGELGKAADALIKAAAVSEETSGGEKQAKELYLRACGLLEAQDKPHFAVDAFRKTLAFMAKRGQFKDAIELLDRMIEIFRQLEQAANVHKCFLSQTVLQLALGDVAAADQKYMAHLQDDAYLASDECAAEEDLVRGFKMGDDALVQATIRKSTFSFLDNQVGRVSRQLSVYGGAAAAPSARTASGSNNRTGSRTGSSNSRNPFAPADPKPSRNPFAPTEDSKPARNPFAPENRARPAPAPVRAPAASVAAPVAVAAASLAAAAPPPAPVSAPAPVPVPAPAPVEAIGTDYTAATDDVDEISTGMGNMDVRATSTDFDFDSLEFAMPDADELEFKMPEDNSYEFEAPTSQAPAPAAVPAPTPAAPVAHQPPAVNEDDFFDLT